MQKEVVKSIIGRLERVDIPAFNLYGIEAKIDTGAYNGAIHVSSIEETIKDGKTYIKFLVLDEEHPEFKDIPHETAEFEKKLIKSSTGDSEIRFIVSVNISIKGQLINAKLSLSNRKELRYPILIGRKIIKKYFLVDPSKKFTY